jgi:hypothetical protein
MNNSATRAAGPPVELEAKSSTSPGTAWQAPLSPFEYLTEPLSRGCNTCRVTGTLTFAGVSGYLLYQRSLVERAARGHRHSLAAMAVGFGAAAVVRWFA